MFNDYMLASTQDFSVLQILSAKPGSTLICVYIYYRYKEMSLSLSLSIHIYIYIYTYIEREIHWDTFDVRPIHLLRYEYI